MSPTTIAVANSRSAQLKAGGRFVRSKPRSREHHRPRVARPTRIPIKLPAAKLHELLARATGCEIEARPYRLGYQLILDQDAVDRLAELLQPAAGANQ